jgi:hypothetical protein
VHAQSCPLKVFSLSHLIELAAQLPDPSKAAKAEADYANVLRLPLRDWDAVRDADHPEREFEAHKETFVEFEVIPWKDTRGVIVPRWVLRGLVTI